MSLEEMQKQHDRQGPPIERALWQIAMLLRAMYDRNLVQQGRTAEGVILETLPPRNPQRMGEDHPSAAAIPKPNTQPRTHGNHHR